MEDNKKIKIIASPTEEDLIIVSDAKGYQVEEVTIENGQEVRTPNGQTRADFIRQVYEGIIIADVARIVTEYKSRNLQEQQRQLAEAVMQGVASSITSVVE